MSLPVKRALVSVFDKTGIEVLGPALQELGVVVLSTGGTAGALRKAGVSVVDVKDVTKWPEMLGGRVKTLHPAIHGGLLANRSEPSHLEQLKEHSIEPIDLVVSNLYPFEKTVASGKKFEECIEMIDIGGPTMVRSAAKNCDSVAVVTSPTQYEALVAELKSSAGCLSQTTRRGLAREAFLSTARYDAAVSQYFCKETEAPVSVMREYREEGALRYGVNPHQKPAAFCSVAGGNMPFSVLNGAPGYTNLMDAMNAWQLVSELEAAVGLPAAASFKHVSPAGAAVAQDLTQEFIDAYEVGGKTLTPQAVAYVRARNADPMSSFGDFAALSGTCDVATAELLKREVSDGCIAADYEPAALEILKAKKGGKYLVLKGNKGFEPRPEEYKEVYGIALSQLRNNYKITADDIKELKTSAKLDEAAVRDLLIATITVKYTQSNSVCYAVGGQVIGVGAGQQSRVDCVKLAGRKVNVWHARTHPKVLALPFKQGVKRVDRINARVSYINDDMTDVERENWLQMFDSVPEPLTPEERAEWQAKLTGVSLSSDAFFPFRDNIDQATKHGVKYILQPGGSKQDEVVIKACNDYGIGMAFSSVRLFHH